MHKIGEVLGKVNKMSMPVTILLASVILGGFYYATQVNKQNSIATQQRLERQAQEEREWEEKIGKLGCVDEAKEAAKNQYQDTCTYDCKEGYYYTANYDSYYNSCLQRKNLD